MALLLVLPDPGLEAVDEFDVDVTVLRALHRLELHDYAERLVAQMERRHPQRADEVLVEKARSQYAAGQARQAEATLARLASRGPAYRQAVLLRAEMAARGGRQEDAAAAYAEFFAEARPPAAHDRAGIETYTRAVTLYSTILKRLGRSSDAAEVLGRLSQLPGASDRKVAFLQAQATIDAEELSVQDKRPVNRDAVLAAIRQLQDLLFLRDGVAAAATLETARAQILLAGEELNLLRQKKKTKEALTRTGFRQALETLRLADEADLWRDIEAQVTTAKDRSASPYAGALYLKGEAYRGLALAHYLADDPATARRLALAAARLLETVVADYGESEYRRPALERHGRCAAFLQQAFGDTVEIAEAGGDAELELKLEQAETLRRNRNDAGAIPLYLEALRRGRRSRRLPEVAAGLIVCLGRAERFLEAQAIASYLAQVQPQAEGTGESLLRLGATMYERAKTLDGDAKAGLLADAMAAWEGFVEAQPDHPKAPEVAFAIAEHAYRQARDRAGGRAPSSGPGRSELDGPSRQAFATAASGYQRLADRYGASSQGVRALYKLGWIHYTVGQAAAAVEAFTRYSEGETRPEFLEDRLEARFRVAELTMRGERPEEAVPQFGELLTWLGPGNDHGVDASRPRIVQLREDVSSYQAWACDLAAEALRPELTQRRERLAELVRQQQTADAAIRGAQEERARLGSEHERVDQEHRETIAALAAIDLDFLRQARAAAAQRPEQQTDPAQLAADRAQRTRTTALGEQELCRAEGERLKTAIAEHQEALATADQALAAARQAHQEALATEHQAEREFVTRRDAMAAAERAVVEGEAAGRDTEDRLQQAQEQREAATAAAARQAADTVVRRLEQELAQVREQTTAAHRTREQVANPAAEARRAALEAALQQARLETRRRHAAVSAAEPRRRQRELAGRLLMAQHRAVIKAGTRAETLARALEPGGAARPELVAELRRQAEEAVAAQEAVRALRHELLGLQEAAATASIQAAQDQLAEVAPAMAELSAAIAPLETSFRAWKTKAGEAFDAFLAAYPKSSHVPLSLARLGAVSLELGQFDRAAAALDRLAREFGGSEVAQDALFSLGRAQWEQGQHAAAAARFTALLRQPGALSAAMLTYISDRMLTAGDPGVSLAASRELLRRLGGSSGTTATAGEGRAAALFRAGQASLRLHQPGPARGYFTTLLTEYPRTGFFYEAQFGLATACREQTPPDLDGALRALAEVVEDSPDPAQGQRALCLMGEALAGDPDPARRRQAVARFQQVVLLADPADAAQRPWLEMALVESAKAFSRLGLPAERDAMLSLYRQHFPDGARRGDVESLPAAEVAPPAAAPPP